MAMAAVAANGPPQPLPDTLVADLHKHASAGNTAEILKLLHSHTHHTYDPLSLLHAPGLKQNTALHFAVLYRHRDSAKALVQNGASITTWNEAKDMPISYCSDGQMLETLLSAYYPRLLSNLDEDPFDVVDSTGKGILHYASLHLEEDKSTDLFSNLIAMASPHQLLLKDKDGATFMKVAAEQGNTTVLEALKWNIDAIDTETQKALINGDIGLSALMHGHRPFFDQLVALSKGIPAKVKITLGDLNKTLVQKIEAMHGDLELAVELARICGNNLPTYLALHVEKDEIFKFLLESRLVTENQWDAEKKRTCLHWAVVHQRVDIIEKLLKFRNVRLSPRIEDASGKTALQLAFENNNQEAMELLRGKAPFKEYEEKLFRDRDVYVQALNAILVGAALIGSVTFAGWLQPPSDIGFGSLAMKFFWVSNSVSFYVAVAAMCVSIAALLPTPTKYVADIVAQLRVELVFAALFLALSLLAVAIAFGSAGYAAAAPNSNQRSYYRILMSSSTIPCGCIGALTLLLFLFRLFKDVLFQDIQLFTNCIPFTLGDKIGCSSRPMHTNGDVKIDKDTDLVGLNVIDHDTLPWKMRKQLKALGFRRGKTFRLGS